MTSLSQFNNGEQPQPGAHVPGSDAIDADVFAGKA